MLQPVRMRFDGYKTTLAELNLKFRKEFVVLTDSTEPDRRAIEAMLSGSPRPDAIIAATEDLVAQVTDIAFRLGLRVPDQINVAGVRDTPAFATTDERLPKVVVQWEKIGREAVRMVTNAIEQGQKLEKVLIPSEPNWT